MMVDDSMEVGGSGLRWGASAGGELNRLHRP